MQQVYDIMVAEGVGRNGATDSAWARKMDRMTPAQKEDYVKQNWHKSARARAHMLALSGIDPATMTSAVSEEVIDYVPGNNK